MKSAAALLMTAALLCGGCSSDDDDVDPNAIKVQDDSYSPATKTVTAGSTVKWQWTGNNSHSVTFTGGSSSETQSSGTFSRSFPTPGEFPYTCLVHGAAMSGTIVVTAAIVQNTLY